VTFHESAFSTRSARSVIHLLGRPLSSMSTHILPPSEFSSFQRFDPAAEIRAASGRPIISDGSFSSDGLRLPLQRRLQSRIVETTQPDEALEEITIQTVDDSARRRSIAKGEAAVTCQAVSQQIVTAAAYAFVGGVGAQLAK
jgi:hypothetical protein